MASIGLAIVVAALAVGSFVFLAWVLLSVWHARGWSGEEQISTGSGTSSTTETPVQRYGFEDCYRFCREHQYLADGSLPLGCEEICRA